MTDDKTNNTLTMNLPDESKLIAETWGDPEYPGIRISLQKPDGTVEILCFAEFNTTKPDGRQLCVCAYTSNIDEPAYYESYADSQPPSPNV